MASQLHFYNVFNKLHQIKEISYNCEFLCWLKTSSSCLHLRLKKPLLMKKRKKCIFIVLPFLIGWSLTVDASTVLVCSKYPGPHTPGALMGEILKSPNPHIWFLRSICFLSNFALGGFVKYFYYISCMWIKMDEEWHYYD